MPKPTRSGPRRATLNGSFWIAPALSALAILAAWRLSRTGGGWFDPYFGTLPPAAVVAAICGIGVAELWTLIGGHGFRMLPDRPWPAVIGALAPLVSLFAVIAIVSDAVFGFPRDINVPWPDAALFYPTIALVVELLFHVVPLALLLPVLRPRPLRLSTDDRFLVAALLISLAEPLFQVRQALDAQSFGALDAITALNVFAINLAQLHVLRRHGFVAMLAFRLLYYALWHLAWGAIRLGLLF